MAPIAHIGLSSATPLSPQDMNRERSTLTGPSRVVESIPPGAGALVMGTGIISIDLALLGQQPLSLVPLVVAGVAWVALGLLLAGRLLYARDRFRREASVPAALTGVAGTAVLGTRLILLNWRWPGAVLLGLAALLWLLLLPRVLRRWVTPTVGASFVLTVSTESLAVLAAVLGLSTRAGWLVLLAVAPLTLGVAFYGFVVGHFDFHQLLIGRGDQWVAGGALAIAALACARTTLAAQALHLMAPGAQALRVATLIVWAAALCWLPFLVAAEMISRRILYDTRRWSTVFPVGMYAACSFAAGTAAHLPPLVQFARIWTWVAVAVWLAVLAATLWQPRSLLRAEGSPGEDGPGPEVTGAWG
jgi:hypothetical protein